MYCPMCGSQNAGTDNFCAQCGHKLVFDSASIFEAPPKGMATTHGEFAFSTSQPLTFEYAGFWRRVIAFWFDWVILFGLTIVLSIPLMAIRGLDHVSDALYLFPNRNPVNTMGLVVNLFLAWFFYYAILESSKMQATLGKRMIGIKVTDYEGKRVSFGRATLRHFSKIISFFIFFIGFLMIAFTRKKQGLHDKIANCLVLKKLS